MRAEPKSWSGSVGFARISLDFVGRWIQCMDEDEPDERHETAFEYDHCKETVTTEDSSLPFNCPPCGRERGFTAVEQYVGFQWD